jgi:adenylate cyclase
VARGLAASLRDDHSQAAEEFRMAARLEPRLFDAYYFHGRVCMNQGRLEDAAKLFAKAADARPEDYQAPALLLTALRGLGRTEDGKAAARRTLDAIERHLHLHPDDVRAVYLASGAWSALGEREKVLEWADRALEMSPDDSGVRYNVACAYASEGLVDEALSLLERNVAVGWGNLEWIKNDPDLDPLRDEPRFGAIIDWLSSRRKDPGP